MSASDFDVVAGNDMQTFLLLSYYKVITQNKKIYIHKSIHFHSYKLFTKFGHFFVLFSANGHKSNVIQGDFLNWPSPEFAKCWAESN